MVEALVNAAGSASNDAMGFGGFGTRLSGVDGRGSIRPSCRLCEVKAGDFCEGSEVKPGGERFPSLIFKQW